jgi:hypothetical protein
VGPAGTASAAAPANIPMVEEPAPAPPTVPIPDAEGPATQGPANHAPPMRHRRPLDDPAIHR